MGINTSFFGESESKIINQFLENGYVTFPLEDIAVLKQMKKRIYSWSLEILNISESVEIDHFFNYTQHYLNGSQLNDFRLQLIAKIARDQSNRSAIFSLSKLHLDWIVGNELAMQRNINLSLQLPGDSSSLLPLHTDVWSGNSPYEVVFWFSLGDCYRTKSAFILPKKESDEVFRHFKEYAVLSTEQFYQKIKDRLIWLEIPYGHGVIFSHILIHGGHINQEEESRWSFNVRFKSLLSPYAVKELGESFLPITIRPVTRYGYNYKKPKVL